MAVDTRHVQGRRKLRFDNYRDMLDDVARLTTGQHRCLGNWTLGQICTHLATTMNMSIDGMPAQAPWPIRLIAGLLLKRRILRGPLRPGFRLPRSFSSMLPQPIDEAEGVAALRQAVERVEREPHRAQHGALGHLTPQQWDQLNLRHAELHLSFVVPT